MLSFILFKTLIIDLNIVSAGTHVDYYESLFGGTFSASAF